MPDYIRTVSAFRAASFLVFVCLALEPSVAVGQNDSDVIVIHAGRMLDVRSGRLIDDARILVTADRITAVGTDVPVPPGTIEIDLTDYVVLPGLIDTHTHLLLEPDYSDINPILYKSIPYRTIEGVAAARSTLLAGFTTVRDIDSEGADWADVALRDAIDNGLVDGPRMQVATRAISITAGHMNQTGLAPQIDVPQFGAIADTRDELIKEVRHQIKYGADLIKLYTTGTLRHIDPETMEVLSQYSYEDILAVVEEAARFGKRVAIHAYGGPGASDAVRAGARSIEHGFLLDDATLDLMQENGTYWVPTMYVYIPDEPQEQWTDFRRNIVESHERVFRSAVEKGVPIAFGTDAGALPHGDNYLEMELMVSYGMTPLQVIRSATVLAADLMDLSDDIGSIEAGKLADIIAVRTNPLDDIGAFHDVVFVMKGGQVYHAPAGMWE
ncbi:MAG: amidohydrolase family protein [Rhodothermales bacterium]|nr:amidohydrolase family protein [Rhodothermales bacterium]